MRDHAGRGVECSEGSEDSEDSEYSEDSEDSECSEDSENSETPTLHHIEHLFLNLLQLILHHHHDILHLRLVALRAGCIDFAPHFLSDKTEFFALPATVEHCLLEVIEVIGEALLFFVDIELFDVVDEFLFKSALVVIHALEFRKALREALAPMVILSAI